MATLSCITKHVLLNGCLDNKDSRVEEGERFKGLGFKGLRAFVLRAFVHP